MLQNGYYIITNTRNRTQNTLENQGFLQQKPHLTKTLPLLLCSFSVFTIDLFFFHGSGRGSFSQKDVLPSKRSADLEGLTKLLTLQTNLPEDCHHPLCLKTNKQKKQNKKQNSAKLSNGEQQSIVPVNEAQNSQLSLSPTSNAGTARDTLFK